MDKLESKEIIAQLKEYNINPEVIKSLRTKLQTGEISETSFIIPKEQLHPPTDSDYVDYNNIQITVTPEQKKHLEEHYNITLNTTLTSEDCNNIGTAAIQRGELGLFWLNGGAATRYFNDSKITPEEKERYSKELSQLTNEERNKPKGVTKVLDNITYLELKIKNLLHIQQAVKSKESIPVIIMNSFVTEQQANEHLSELLEQYVDLKPSQFHNVTQKPTVPRWTNPEEREEIDVYTDKKGNLSFAPGGHGDFLELLQGFFKHNTLNIKYLFFANIDNFGSSIDPTILGIHIASQQGRTVELAPKQKGDKGGAPCFVNDKLVVVEQMKFPEDFDQDQITTFNTNTFWFTVEDLLNYKEPLPYVMAEKNINGDEVIQLERIACDANLETTFVNAPRKKRFWPTKRYIDLVIYKDPNTATVEQQQAHKEFKELLQNEYGVEL